MLGYKCQRNGFAIKYAWNGKNLPVGDKALKKLQTIITGIIILMVFIPSVFAAVTGKISGVVEDGFDSKPVIGATVRVLGTSLITKTDEDGEYYLINIPIGKYNIAVTHVGFDTLTQTDVRVLLDLTTPVDFQISEMTVNLDNNMVSVKYI